jgi:ferrous iron transport protein A
LLVADVNKAIIFALYLLIRLNQNKRFVEVSAKVEKQLEKACIGAEGCVSHFTNECMACKLISMGILPGTTIKLLRRAPFGGGCYVKADNMLLALRKSEACSIVLR